MDVNGAAAASDISLDELTRLARIFAEVERPLAIPGHALTGMANGIEAVNAVHALNFVVGNFNQPGGMALASAPKVPAPVTATEPFSRNGAASSDRMNVPQRDVTQCDVAQRDVAQRLARL